MEQWQKRDSTEGELGAVPHELVSALVDGQLRGDALTQAMTLLRSSEQARAAWRDYHVVREALQSGQADVSRDDAEFLARLRVRLTQQPARPQADPVVAPTQRPLPLRVAANDGRWRRVAGLASVALVGLLAWRDGVTPGSAVAPGPAVLAQTAAEAVPPLTLAPLVSGSMTAAATPPVMIRDPRLDAWLQAHRPLDGGVMLQAPSDFLRNATFDPNAR